MKNHNKIYFHKYNLLYKFKIKGGKQKCQVKCQHSTLLTEADKMSQLNYCTM